jgi:DNA-binding LacI/PurR family transcriptional regulator
MVTLKDIANRLGLSPTTISQVLNGNGERLRIKPETCARVVAAARSMGYQPSEAPRSMVRGHSRLVAYLAPLVWPEFVASHIEGAAREANRHQLLMQIVAWNLVDDFASAIDSLVSHNPLGVLVQAASVPELEVILEKTRRRKIPLVTLDSASARKKGILRIRCDEAQGADLAVDHLAALGHRRIALLTRPWNPTPDDTFADLRQKGFLKAMAKRKLPTPPGHVLNAQEGDQIAAAVTALFANRKQAPTALFCVADTLALPAMKSLRAMGLRVPDDVSVVGFGEMMMSAYCDPELTTVRQPYRDIGARGVQRLIDLRAGRAIPGGEEIFPVELVVRASTAPAPRG